jgi:membrane protein YqaA with SNARE-associated domain
MEQTSNKRDALKLGLTFVLGVVGLVAVVSLLGHHYRAELESMGRTILDRFGYVGIALGTFIADGIHFPIPPQFYMLASIAAGWSVLWTLVAVCMGSMLGGVTAYSIARKASHLRVFQRLLARTQRKVDSLFARFGYWAVALVSLTPIPFSMLCYVAGAHRMRARMFVVLSLFRIPKLVLYFYVVKLGWASGG